MFKLIHFIFHLKYLRNFKYILLLLLICCSNKKEIYSSKSLNTVYNSEYINSVKSFYGELNKTDYENAIRAFEVELGTIIPNGNLILINYEQKGQHCISMDKNGKHYLESLERSTEISSRISSQNKTLDFFVFAKNAFANKIVEKDKYFILDSGFFYKNIFTEHDNCSAFFILKPNGKFMKYYGEDYYSKVIKFLKSK